MEYIGKTIATLGIWAAVAVVGWEWPFFMIFMLLPAALATTTIWEN